MRFDGPLDARKVVKKIKRKFWFDKRVHEWEVLAPFRFYFDDENPERFIQVDAGWRTDLASVPGIFGFVIQKDGIWSQAAVTHDWSYKNRGDVVYIEKKGKLIKQNPLSRKEQDRAFENGMQTLGTNLPTRFIMFRAVRRFGFISYPKK